MKLQLGPQKGRKPRKENSRMSWSSCRNHQEMEAAPDPPEAEEKGAQGGRGGVRGAEKENRNYIRG